MEGGSRGTVTGPGCFFSVVFLKLNPFAAATTFCGYSTWNLCGIRFIVHVKGEAQHASTHVSYAYLTPKKRAHGCGRWYRMLG